MKRCEMKCNNVNTKPQIAGQSEGEKQTNKQANIRMMGQGGEERRENREKRRERSVRQQQHRKGRSSTNKTCEWRPTPAQAEAEAEAIEPANGAQNWRK